MATYGDHVLDGGNGIDVLLGGPGDDTLTGRNGSDPIEGVRGDDSVGNLVSKDGVGFTVDAANQLTTDTDGTVYSYDEAGRLVGEVRADGATRGLSYDARGLLVQEVITEGAGQPVTDPCLTATPTITGTEGDDVITGTSGDDVIFGLGGNDQIDGGNGRDLICGGDGDDILIDGSNSQDILSGGAGSDVLDGGNGIDVLIGGPGDDTLTGGNGSDSLFGGDGVDILDGGLGDDTLDGGAGVDTLTGDRGNDTLQGGPDTDAIDGGKGDDQCEPEPGRVGCELDLPSGEPARTVYTRGYDGDGLLSQVAVTHPDGSVDVYGFTWDKTLPVPQIVSYTLNGDKTSVVYGMNRALSIDASGTASGFEYSVLGDVTGGFASVASSFDPYGEPDAVNATVDVGFGYRGELHVGGMVYLRFRDLDPTLGRFNTIDPLSGVPGTTTVGNQYAYANSDPIGAVDPWGLRPADGVFTFNAGTATSDIPAFSGLDSELDGAFGALDGVTPVALVALVGDDPECAMFPCPQGSPPQPDFPRKAARSTTSDGPPKHDLPGDLWAWLASHFGASAMGCLGACVGASAYGDGSTFNDVGFVGLEGSATVSARTATPASVESSYVSIQLAVVFEAQIDIGLTDFEVFNTGLYVPWIGIGTGVGLGGHAGIFGSEYAGQLSER